MNKKPPLFQEGGRVPIGLSLSHFGQYDDVDTGLGEPEIPEMSTEPSGPDLFELDFSKLEGHTNEVRNVVNASKNIKDKMSMLSPEQLLGSEGQRLIETYNNLVNPSTINTLKKSYEYSQKAIEHVDKNQARDTIVSINGRMYVRKNDNGEVIKVTRVDYINSKSNYTPLTAGELIHLRDNDPKLVNNTEINQALSSIQGVSAVDEHITKQLDALGSYKNKEFSEQIGQVIKSKGMVAQTNVPQASSALKYLEGTLTPTMLETLKNQAALSIKGPKNTETINKEIDGWVKTIIAEKVASKYLIAYPDGDSSSGGAGGPVGNIYQQIDSGNAALDWETVNVVDSKDPTKRYEAMSTKIPMAQMEVLDKYIEIKDPGAKATEARNRTLADVDGDIMLANGAIINPHTLENASEFVIVRATGEVMVLPDPKFRNKYDDLQQQLNKINSAQISSPQQQQGRDQQAKIINESLAAVPKHKYFKYLVVTDMGNLQQNVFTHTNPETNETEEIVKGMIVKDLTTNNPFAAVVTNNEAYKEKYGGLINDAVELPVFIRLTNLGFMLDKENNAKYAKMLEEERRQQMQAKDNTIRMTSQSVVANYIK